MCDNDSDSKDSIARELGWPCYDAAPQPVQNNIDAGLEADITDPFAALNPEPER